MAQQYSVQFTTNKRLATLRGHVILFKAFEPKMVPEAIYRQAMSEGGIDGNMKLAVQQTQDSKDAATVSTTDQNSEEGIGEVEGTGTDSGVLRVAQICREIIDAADMDKLTSGNKPKLSSLSQDAGFEVSSELRDEAMKLVADGIV